MTRFLSATVAIVGIVSVAQAAELPRPAKYDERVRMVDYNPDQVVNVAGKLLTATQIEFGHDERIVFAGVGNPIWEVVAKENFLFVKPREAHGATNMNVVTVRGEKQERRSYQIALAVMKDGGDKPFFLLRYRYPTDEERRRQVAQAEHAAAAKAAQVDKVLAADEKNAPRNWAYTVQGEGDFEPVAVFDNGKVTTIIFKGNTEIPAIYLEADGKEELVPKNVTAGRVTVHAVVRKFVLRRGDVVMCLFNERYQAEGVDTLTKTTSPRVDRVVNTGAKQTPAFSTAAPAVTQTVFSLPQAAPTKAGK
jgi:type IV secretion system protein VirB9